MVDVFLDSRGGDFLSSTPFFASNEGGSSLLRRMVCLFAAPARRAPARHALVCRPRRGICFPIRGRCWRLAAAGILIVHRCLRGSRRHFAGGPWMPRWMPSFIGIQLDGGLALVIRSEARDHGTRHAWVALDAAPCRWTLASCAFSDVNVRWKSRLSPSASPSRLVGARRRRQRGSPEAEPSSFLDR